MLFDWGQPIDSTMWMRNTIAPLDMVFINADGTVHRVEADTVPQSLAIIDSKGPVRATLELAAGTAKRLGIQAGRQGRGEDLWQCGELKPMSRPPLPPFTEATAAEKARLAEDAWNSRDPARVALAYTPDSQWRNRAEFIHGREEIEAFLTRKWARELDYRLIKEVWTHAGNRIAVRFAYEYHDDSGNWFRAYGNENWQFDADGLMERRIASINEHPIARPTASSTGRLAGGPTSIPA